ncbi:MAG: IPTL-CTERM sorting domain-containing protein [Thermoanaerobaculia bacterium]|nr:IPTL-CTERM sorting domain-containing protein [Thermoanaerobaculia bacterium]
MAISSRHTRRGRVLAVVGAFFLAGGARGITPPTPNGCTAAASSFSQATAVAIPSGPGVVTSTLVVSGAGPYLWDVDLSTAITHRFSADLDITLESPAGTIVTLTTDNGAGNDHVFNGTVWDDDANPAGQVRYTLNDGLVTDHGYADATLAAALVPEEAMGAFVGENPNGVWKLTVSDDLSGDGGSVARWTLDLTTFPSSPAVEVTVFAETTAAVTIPSGPAVVTSTVNLVGADVSLCDLDVVTHLRHSFPADLDVTLKSPAGTIVTLTSDNGNGNDHVFDGTSWDDDANPGGPVPYVTNAGLVTDHPYSNGVTATPLVPEEALAAFLGENPNGTWTLTVSDDLSGDGGVLNGWSIAVTTCSCGSADLAVSIGGAPGSVVAGLEFDYGVTVRNGGPSPATNVQVADNLPSQARFVAVTPSAGGQCAGPGPGSGGNVGCTWPGTTEPTTTRRLDLSVAVCPEALCGDALTHRATVSSVTPDPATANGTARAVSAVEAMADLVVTQTADVETLEPGGLVTYTVTVDNLGPSNAAGVSVTHLLPTGVEFASATVTPSGTCAPLGTLVECVLGTVGAPEQCSSTPVATQFTVTLLGRATLDLPAGPLVHTAFATSSNCLEDPTPEDAEASITVSGLGFQDPPVVPVLDPRGLVILTLALGLAAGWTLRRRS